MAQSRKSSLPRLTVRVPEAFRLRLQDVHRLLQRKQRWFYDGEKLSQEGIATAAILAFMEMDEKAQARLLDRHLPAVEAMFREAEATPNTPGAPGAPPR